MSYKFFSFRDPSGQNEEQWAARTVEGEIVSSYTRSLVEIFTRYLVGDHLNVMEAGCGLGGWLPFFEKMGHEVVGIEYEKDVVKRVKEYRPDMPIEAGDIFDLQYPDNSFDAYISLGVIEHFEEGPHKPLDEAARVLKPGGLAFITVPYLSLFRRFFSHPLREVYFFLRRIQGKKDFFWEYRYTKKELAGFISDAGFELIDTLIDDYIPEDRRHHIGLYADFFFLRKRDGEIWELNLPGRMLLGLGRLFSPWLFCSGLHMVVRNTKTETER